MKSASAIVLVSLFIAVDTRGAAAPAEAAPAQADPAAGSSGGDLTPKEAEQIAADAYIFAYPLVTMEMTKRVSTNVARPAAAKAPVGQFANLRQYPTPSNKTVTAPNADTLYSVAWLDLSKEPMVFSHPDMGQRFYMFPVLDAYTNVVRTPGTRDDGGAAATYVITGPDWKEEKLPEGAFLIKSPTNMAWILGRTYSTGTSQDLDEVHKLQAKYELRPLSAATGYKPPAGKVSAKIDEKKPVRDQVDAMKADQYFGLAAELMGQNPPTKADAAMLAKMAKIGLVPGKPFKTTQLPTEIASAVQAAPEKGQDRIKAQAKKGGATMVNGWMVTTKTGEYATDYDQRAFVTAVGLGANTPDQAVYPIADTDGSGQKLSGKNKYVMHFGPGEMPPARAFWSMTMYTSQMFFYPNDMKRYTVSSRTDLKKNDDGSVDVFIQHDKPAQAAQVSNWLPAPKDDFALMLRLYWPNEKRPSILDGTWKPPAVTPVSEAPRMGRAPSGHRRPAGE